jgi:hypothetical protein
MTKGGFNMEYMIRYHLGDNLAVNRLVKSEDDKEIVLLSNSSEDVIKFVDSKDVLHRFKMNDVKLVTIHEHKKASVTSVKGYR